MKNAKLLKIGTITKTKETKEFKSLKTYCNITSGTFSSSELDYYSW